MYQQPHQNHAAYRRGSTPQSGTMMPPSRNHMMQPSGNMQRQSGNLIRPHGYMPVSIPPAKPYPADPYMEQLPLSEALRTGTLFRWLNDPYSDPYRG